MANGCEIMKCEYWGHGRCGNPERDCIHAPQSAEIDELFERGKRNIVLCKQLQAENKQLREFARQVIKGHCWGIEMDGLEIQDLAEKLELIAKHTATEDDVDDESDYEVGDIIYKFTKALTQASAPAGKKGD